MPFTNNTALQSFLSGLNKSGGLNSYSHSNTQAGDIKPINLRYGPDYVPPPLDQQVQGNGNGGPAIGGKGGPGAIPGFRNQDPTAIGNNSNGSTYGGPVSTVGRTHNIVPKFGQQVGGFVGDHLPDNSSRISEVPTRVPTPNDGSGYTNWFVSDENQKEDITEAGSALKSFLDNLKPYQYDYKNPGAPGQKPGRQTGVMAQDLEKSDEGRELVHETPNGKMVNYMDAAPKMMAGLAFLNEKVNKLSKVKAKKG